MRILLFGNGGHAALVLQSLLDRGETVVGVCSRAPDTLALAARRALAIAARRAVPALRAPFLGHDPFAGLEPPVRIARRHGIPVIPSRALNSAETPARLRALEPDVLLVAGFHRLIPPAVAAVARQAAINLHAGPLPGHRGGTPNRWVVRNGEAGSAATAHLLTEEFDAGAVVGERRCSVAADDTWGEVEVRVARLMPALAGEVIDAVRSGTLRPQPQSLGAVRYEPPFHGRHHELDWSLPAVELRRICLAMRPKSGGMGALDGRRLCVWDLEPRAEVPGAAPGTVAAVGADGVPVVACGGSSAALLAFLWRGDVLSAAQHARRMPVAAGTRFDPRPA